MAVRFGRSDRWAIARRAILWGAAACLLASTLPPPRLLWAQETPRRSEKGLLVLYTFVRSDGDQVVDQSPNGAPLNLKIETPGSVQLRDGRLTILSSARIRSTQPATKIHQAVKRSGELSLEAWLTPADDRQTGPARIVSLSADTSRRNVTLGQEGRGLDVRLRTTATSDNGLPSLAAGLETRPPKPLHVVYTRNASGSAALWIDGRQVASRRIEGDLASWDESYRLSLGNELTGDRPWTGQLHLVAIYGLALDESQVAANFAAGVPAAIDYAALLPPAAERPVQFVRDVQPIFRKRCFECHAEGNEEGGLNLGRQARVMEGGRQGPVLERGNSAGSRLVHLVAGLEKDQRMPPDGEPLTPEQIGVLRAWIDQGAKWPAGADVLDPRTERARRHWAFQPLRPRATSRSADQLPAVRNEDWCRTPIDRFILARLETAALAPTPPLEPGPLVRRLYFDLTGLPPTPEEAAHWTAQLGGGGGGETPNPEALGRLVDHLLAQRHFGERWGRHWLDVARYSDSDGQEADRDRPLAYLYRDFVIRALNDDMPFDTFVRWQLAGDEYQPDDPAAVAATGFLTAGPHTVLEDTFLEEERLRNRYNELDDMLSTIGTGLLGLTIGCARCHDHKYDAIASREYYRLSSALHSGDRAEVPLGKSGQKALAFRDHGSQPAATWLFERGDFYDRDQPVQLGFVSVLSRGKTAEEYWNQARSEQPLAESTYQRKALAEWITDVDQGAGPLLARVIVNRLWQHHFGQGLVPTVGDFGVRGQTASHPELLEWLASDLVAHGWRMKRLHRLIVTSAVYQQATTWNEGGGQVDPENRLLWRMRPRRLEAEVLRDAMLAVSGTLNLEAYGPAFKPPISNEAMVARNLKTPYPSDVPDGPAVLRRSVYMFHKRVIPYPLLQAFDRPDSLQSCGQRENTTVAPQALALLNDPFVRSRAQEFAALLLAEVLMAESKDDQPATNDPSPDENAKGDFAAVSARLVPVAFQRALGRLPTPVEQAQSAEFLAKRIEQRRERRAGAAIEEVRRLAVADFCQAVFSLNEFLYVD